MHCVIICTEVCDLFPPGICQWIRSKGICSSISKPPQVCHWSSRFPILHHFIFGLSPRLLFLFCWFHPLTSLLIEMSCPYSLTFLMLEFITVSSFFDIFILTQDVCSLIPDYLHVSDTFTCFILLFCNPVHDIILLHLTLNSSRCRILPFDVAFAATVLSTV